MTWVKLDDNFWMHPKIVRAGNESAGIFARCLSYCGKYLTDGKLPREVALNISGNSKRKLQLVIEQGLLQELPSGELYVHDFLDYNPPSDEVNARTEARRAAGRRGGLAKASAIANGRSSRAS